MAKARLTAKARSSRAAQNTGAAQGRTAGAADRRHVHVRADQPLHAAVDEHDVNGAIVVHPPETAELYGPQAETGDAWQIVPPDADGEVIHVRLLDAEPEAFGAKYMLASLDGDALACATGFMEAQIQRAGENIWMEGILEDAAEFGGENNRFRLANIGPEP